MKKVICLILLVLNGLISYSQNSAKEIFYYEKPFKSNNNTTYIYDISGMRRGGALSITADSGTSRMSSVIFHPNKPHTSFVHLENASTLLLTVNIDKDSLKYFSYSVIQDDSIYLAKNLKPAQFGKSEYYGIKFGPYHVYNKKISVIIIENGTKEREVIIYCKKLSEVELVDIRLEEVFNNERVTKLTKSSKGDTTLIERSISQWRNLNINGGLVPINPNYSFAQITIKPIENIFLYRVLIKRTRGSDSEVTEIYDLNWKFNVVGNLACRLDSKNFDKPGKYEVIICPLGANGDNANIKNSTKINFEMKRPSLSNKQLGIYSMLIFITIIVLFLAIFFILKRRNKKKLRLAEQQKMMSQMQLQAVRSQLNPHFMFNALAGIQSLMNKRKTEEANEYLGKFARITRNVLDNRELTSLADEKALLDDYLQMEQFRFGFNYQIKTDKELDLENTEIPSMLLQPFVENAVKHGISDYGEGGKITILFKQKQNDLLLEITDNGKGFDSSQKYKGLGLQLSKDRIALLNNIYKETPFLMEILSNDKGTTITIKLINWL